ncbi:MAG: DUF11 domain-containing protein [Proteobacteria bacterium]|nr:DUF11 domain-containing protein [Pseudomonadota bacterium]
MKKLGMLILLLMASMQLYAQTICAIVKIEIRQELSFERQAFDAKMIISNGLDIANLENLNIDVWFEDIDGNPVLATSDPDNTNAKFFIRIDTMDGVNDINGSGVINAGESAEIHWLIIPAPGTGGVTPAGLRYGVGATVSYTFGEESQTVNVVPDFITVSPTPLLKLDYFLPTDVFGDNPLTPEVEPIEPFDLGLRISNIGFGFADNLKIESAQPKIIENDQGLLIDFELLGTAVNDAEVTNSLLADIGRLDAGESTMVSWLMQSSLNGEFISFEADFVHSDDLGGLLTSLIDSPIDTHILFHRVKVDYTGRDQIRDFLAYDEDILRVYESNGGQAEVIDESATVAVTNLGIVDGKQKYQVNFTAVAGASFARWSDPYNGTKQEVTAFRSDGKLIPTSNIWQYRIETDPGVFEFYFGLFDVESTGQYEVIINGLEPNIAPVITVTSPQNGEAGMQMQFNIEVTDANPDDVLTLVSIGAPIGSSVSFVSGNTWQFSWLPQQTDIGTIDFVLSASDQIVQTTKSIQMIISDSNIIDTDNDGMADDWEQTHFGNLGATAGGDADLDSATNLQEYNFGGDPNQEDRPHAPQIVSTNNGALLDFMLNDLIVINAISATDANIVYEFELYESEISDNPITTATISETNVQTVWTHGITLVEDKDYIWRVRAYDGITPSAWSYDSFQFSATNNPPINCGLDYPVNAQIVSTFNPSLSVISAVDTDSPSLQYRLQVFSDAALMLELADSGWMSGDLIAINNDLTVQWQPYNVFHDVTSYYWSASVKDEITTIACGNGEFSLNVTTTEPSGYALIAPVFAAVTDVNTDIVISHDSSVVNSDDYNYYFEIDTLPTFNSANLQQSSGIAFDTSNQATWSLSGLQNDTEYFSRVKANDGAQDGRWIYSKFKTRQAIDQTIVHAINPANTSWVTSTIPKLEFYVSSYFENIDDFTAEIYSDAAATNLLHSENLDYPIWITPQLTDRQHFYWRVKANLIGGLANDYTPLQKFFIIDDPSNEAPSFEFLSLINPEENASNIYPIIWTDNDSDSNAMIDLYYDDDNSGSDGILIVSGILEDDFLDSYNWDISAIANDNYYLYAIITDEQSSSTIYSANSLEVKHHEISVIASGVTTSETGTSIAVDVALNKAPDDYVIVAFTASDNTEATINVQRLIFTPDNWMLMQQFTVTGVDDTEADGNQAYAINFAGIQSNDISYASLTLASINLTNIDDEVASPEIDLVMEKDIVSLGSYNVGSNVIYELIITNQGSNNASDVVITDSMTNLSLVSASGGDCLPVDSFPCTIASIPANSSKTITLVTIIDSSGIFDNSATATASIAQIDIDLSNNTDNTNNDGATAGPNLGVTLTNCSNELMIGQDITYKLTVTNLGDIDIANAILTSDLSPYLDSLNWICQTSATANCQQNNGTGNVGGIITLPVDASMTFTIAAQVIGVYGDIVQANVNIQMPSGITDIDLSNNSDNDNDTITNLIFINGFEVINDSCN